MPGCSTVSGGTDRRPRSRHGPCSSSGASPRTGMPPLPCSSRRWRSTSGDGKSIYYPEFGVSLQLPLPRFTTEERRPRQLHLKDVDRGLDVMLFRDSGHRTAAFHNGLRDAHDGRSELYTLRERESWVTKTSEGSIRNYARSFVDRRTGEWVTVWLNWADWSTTQGLIISSIEEGRGPELGLPEDSRSADHVALILAMIEEEEENEPSAPEASRAWSQPDSVTKSPGGSSSGTGFYVNAGGAVLTNAHVVEGCGRLQCRWLARSTSRHQRRRRSGRPCCRRDGRR